MATFSIALDACLQCDYRRVEAGDTVLLNLDPTKFDQPTLDAFSPVPAVVLEVRLPEPPEPVDAAMTIELEVADPDMPPGFLVLESDDLESVTCQDCCMNLTARVELLEGSATLYDPNITGLTGGGPTNLDGIPTLTLSEGELRLVRVADATYQYRLSISSAATASPQYIRAADWADPSNRKVWTLASTNVGKVTAYGGINGASLGVIISTSISGLIFGTLLTGKRMYELPNASGTFTLGNGAGVTDPPAFRAAIGAGSSSTLSSQEVAQILPLVTGLTGGGASNLDGTITTTMTLGSKRIVYVAGLEYVYELAAGTSAEGVPGIIRPDDYNGTTNARIWLLRPRYVDTSTLNVDTLVARGAIYVGAPFIASGAITLTSFSGLDAVIECSAITSSQTVQMPDGSGFFALTGQPDGRLIADDITWSAGGDNATPGYLGEFIQTLVAAGAAIPLTTTTAASVATVVLTPGDWDVEGSINFVGTAATITERAGSVTVGAATLATDGSQAFNGYATTTATEVSSVTLPRKRVSLAAPATIHLVAGCTFTAGAVGAFGQISARRVR